ncbi:hypothetical protein [Paenibacillus sp. FSL L8-0708]
MTLFVHSTILMDPDDAIRPSTILMEPDDAIRPFHDTYGTG